MANKYIKQGNSVADAYNGEAAGIGVNNTVSGSELLNYNPNGTKKSVPADSGVYSDRAVRVGVKALTGLAIHDGSGGVVAWQNPESVSIIIQRAVLDLTTVSTGACTLDVGVTEVSATTTSDTLLDGIDANAATAVFDSMNAALDGGANAKAQKLASGKWVTIDEKTGDATGLVGNLYIYYTIL